MAMTVSPIRDERDNPDIKMAKLAPKLANPYIYTRVLTDTHTHTHTHRETRTHTHILWLCNYCNDKKCTMFFFFF